MSTDKPCPLTAAPEIEEEKRQLLQEMKVTKGSRFNAAERLGRRDRLINQMTAFVSGCVIIVTLLPVYFQVGATATSVVSFATIAFSIFILAMSLLQYSNSDPVRAEQHHRCALEINGLRRELRSSKISTREELLLFTRRFDDILQKYSVNHETIDFDRYKQEHPDEYPDVITVRKSDKMDLSIDTSVERLARSSGKIAAVVTASIIASLAGKAAYEALPYLSKIADAVRALFK
jgi:hypothetical protein